MPLPKTAACSSRCSRPATSTCHSTTWRCASTPPELRSPMVSRLVRRNTINSNVSLSADGWTRRLPVRPKSSTDLLSLRTLQGGRTCHAASTSFMQVAQTPEPTAALSRPTTSRSRTPGLRSIRFGGDSSALIGSPTRGYNLASGDCARDAWGGSPCVQPLPCLHGMTAANLAQASFDQFVDSAPLAVIGQDIEVRLGNVLTWDWDVFGEYLNRGAFEGDLRLKRGRRRLPAAFPGRLPCWASQAQAQGCSSGNSSTNSAPPSGWLLAVRRPPCCSTMP